MTGLAVSVTLHGGSGAAYPVVHAAGEADVTTPGLHDAIFAELAKTPRLLLVDTSRLTFMDSSALQVIISAHSQLRAAGGVLALISPSARVARLLQLTGADRVIPVYGRAEDAAESVRSASPAGRPEDASDASDGSG